MPLVQMVTRISAVAYILCVLSATVRAGDLNVRPYGLDTVKLWTTSRVVGSPEPPRPYTVRRVFEKLTFDQPVHLLRGPMGKRLFLTERMGRIVSFPDDPNVTETDFFLDVGLECHTIVFHPKFEEKPYVYAFVNNAQAAPKGTTPRDQFFRYEVTRDDPPRAIPESKYLILETMSDGHNGGAMVFGNDGMLYITIGDGTGDSDVWRSGQDLGNLNAALLRIDVDYPDPGRPYSIPIDNPFRTLIGARPEIWAYGFRNPWRMFVDRPTGDIFVGDVGQDLWEMICWIERGGNYGWSVTEGSHDFYPLRRRGPTPILPPLVEHHHTEARSITGGVVYRGAKLPALDGAYLYGDYETGKIWGVRHEGNQVTWHEELADTSLRPAAFEEGHSGRFYIVAHLSNEIHELIPAPPRSQAHDFPRRLSETGLFTSTRDLTPAGGLIPYSVNAPQWRDGAVQERYLALPGAAQFPFGATGTWQLPDLSVLVKTLSLPVSVDNPAGSPLKKGDPRPGVAASRAGRHPRNEKAVDWRLEAGGRRLEGPRASPVFQRAASSRRIETQLLTRQEGQWYGYTYVWNDEQTDAELAPAGGMDLSFAVVDPAVSGGQREQSWHIASRTECMVCHSRAAGFVLGMRTIQMNREHDYGRAVAQQIPTLNHLGVFTTPVTTDPAKLDRLADPYDESADLERRARSYLHANCSHCHIGSGGGNAMFNVSFQTKPENVKLIGVRPLHADFGITGAMLVAPGQPQRSVLLQRISRRGNGQMPPLDSSVVDHRAVDLMRDWITGLEVPEDQRRAMDLAVAETQGESGALTRWYATGPLPVEQAARIVQHFAITETKVDPSDGQSPPWRVTFGDGSEARVKLGAGKEAGPESVCIGRTDVIVPEPTNVQFLGSCSGTMRVWLNGKVIYQRDQARAYDPGSDRFDATLVAGENRLLVQASFPNGDDAFHLGFRRISANPEHERLILAALNGIGNAERGGKMFFDQEKALCIKCHRLGEFGVRIGPELTGVGGRLSRARIIESILEPSRTIAPKYETIAVAMADGRILTGVAIAETDQTLTLGGNEGQQYVLGKANIEEREVQTLSLMPEGLEKGLTQEQFVDLIAFLSSQTEIATPTVTPSGK